MSDDELEHLLDTLALGMQLKIERPRHRIVVMKTLEVGIHTGHPRFLVACITCDRLLHDATTGVLSRIEDHEYRSRI